MCSQATIVINAIQAADADLVCLQETNEGWEYACNHFLRSQYPNQYFFHSETGYYAAGIAFLHKKNFTPSFVRTVSPKVEGSYFDGNLISGTFSEGTIVNIVNVHLRPPLSMGNDDNGILGNLDVYFRKAGPIHSAEIQSFLQALNTLQTDPSNTFVVGDFNEGYYGDGYQFLAANGMTDALTLCSDQTTWYWPIIWGQNISGSYDHIFSNPQKFKTLSCNIMREYRDGSDHCPVLATFSVKH